MPTLMADVLVELEATGVLPPVRTAAETRRPVAAGAVSVRERSDSPSAVPVAPAILPQSAPARWRSRMSPRPTRRPVRCSKKRSRGRPQLDQREADAAAARARARRPAPGARGGIPAAANAAAGGGRGAGCSALAPVSGIAPVGPSVGARTEGARFTPVRHETAWARFKRLMLGQHELSARGKLTRHSSRENYHTRSYCECPCSLPPC